MKIKDQLDAAGVELVAIGNGTPEEARAFIDKFKFNGELYVDQDLDAYEAFQLKRGFWVTLGPKSLLHGFSAFTQGFRQGLTAGDPLQQGGMFVIGPGPQLHYEHRNHEAGDHANLNELINACSL